MWMMSYSDGGGDFNVPDSFNGRKLRPLVPRPLSSANNNNNPSSPTPPCLTRFHGPDFFSLNHQLGSHFGEQNKREYNTAPVVVSSRWNPTPEQLRTLEELYRRGTRTPTADQIQHITAQLRRYGKIEGKNVFYWFQNHKARERQKRRRQMESSALDHNNNDLHLQDMDRNKDSGENRTAYEVEQNKTNWAAPTNCSTLSERIKTKAAGGSIQLHEAELLLQQQQRRNFVERNATWQNMMHDQVSCPPPKTPRSMEANQQLMMMKSGTTTRDLNIFLTPYKANDALLINDEEHEDSHQTLELFPLRSGDAVQNNNFDKATSDVSLVSAVDANLNPNYHFFEFLPLKDN